MLPSSSIQPCSDRYIDITNDEIRLTFLTLSRVMTTQVSRDVEYCVNGHVGTTVFK